MMVHHHESRCSAEEKKRLKKQELIFDLQANIIKVTCSAKFSEQLILRNQTWFNGTVESSFSSNAEQSHWLLGFAWLLVRSSAVG